MDRPGVYTADTARIVLETVRYLRANGFVVPRPGRGSQFVPPEAPIYVRNDSGAEIPPFACMQTSGAVDAGGQNYIKVVKPVDDTGAAGRYLFNSIAPIEIGGYGVAYAGPLVRMLTDGSTVTCGDSWQPVVGSWSVTTGGSLFTAAGADDIDTNIMRAFIGASGGMGRIEFEVTSATTISDSGSPYDGMRELTVTVVGPSCNRASMLGETGVKVYEHVPLCLTGDETDEALVGRKGWAFEGVFQDQSAEAEAGDLTPCHWVLDGICCPP